MHLHEHDTRKRKCANAGCPKPATYTVELYLTERTKVGYCDKICELEHAELMARHGAKPA